MSEPVVILSGQGCRKSVTNARQRQMREVVLILICLDTTCDVCSARHFAPATRGKSAQISLQMTAERASVEHAVCLREMIFSVQLTQRNPPKATLSFHWLSDGT